MDLDGLDIPNVISRDYEEKTNDDFNPDAMVINLRERSLEGELIWLDAIVNQIQKVNELTDRLRVNLTLLSEAQADLLTILTQLPIQLRYESLVQALISVKEVQHGRSDAPYQ